jgi:hypothetical protein
MPADMTLDGAPVPIGEVSLRFQYFLDDGPPHAWIDVSSTFDSAWGGVAINCLNIGDVPALGRLSGRRLAFGDGEAGEGSELRESVFWLPGDDTLEIESLAISFGELVDGRITLDIEARCFDLGARDDVRVRIRANVAVTA